VGILATLKRRLIRYPSADVNTQKSSVLFLFRSTADFDHMVPIAWKLSKNSPKHRVIFACTDIEFPYRKTQLARYVIDHLGVDCVYLHEVSRPGVYHRVFTKYFHYLQKLAHDCSYEPVRLTISSLMNLIFWGKLGQILYDYRYYRYLLISENINRIVIDPVATQKHKWPYRAILPVASGYDIPIICIPHSAPSMVDHLSDNTTGYDLPERYRWISHFLVSGEGAKYNYISGGLKAEDIDVVGNPRYCQEWIDQWGEICGDADFSEGFRQSFKIIIIEPPQQHIVTENYLDLIRSLSAIEGVDLRVLPHPRKKDEYILSEHFPDLIIDKSSPSSRMVKWCDVAIVEFSSLAWECLERNKFIIHIDYITDRQRKRESLFKENGVGLSAENTRSVLETVAQVRQGEAQLPLDSSRYQQLRQKAIYAGLVEDRVLERYVEEIIRP